MPKIKQNNMKKLIIAAVIAVGFSTAAFAQDKGDVEFGVQFGYNASNVSDSDDSGDYLSGFNFGVGGDYYFSDRWSLKVKALYDQKGFEQEAYNFDTDQTFVGKFRTTYLTIPVMANWHFGSKRNWYLNFGPYAGFLLKAEETNSGIDTKDAYNTTDFGLALGIGVKIPVTDRLKVFLEFDGQGGFSNIAKTEDGDDVGTITNTRSSFNVGLNFMLK